MLHIYITKNTVYYGLSIRQFARNTITYIPVHITSYRPDTLIVSSHLNVCTFPLSSVK